MLYKNIIKQLAYLILPTAVFFMCYTYIGILPAMAVSAFTAIVVMVFHLFVHKKVTNTQILSLLGLSLSFIAIYYTNNEKFYYIPDLITNFAIACFAVILTVRKKSVFHFFVKDLRLKLFQSIAESELIALNFLWIAFFALKIVSKIVGILFLDFKVLYWLVFALGDPMTIVVVILSVLMIKRKASKSDQSQEES